MDKQVIAVYRRVYELYTVGGRVGMVQLFCRTFVLRTIVPLFRHGVW